MMDMARIKANVGRMVQMGAPETDIDAYIQGEGTSIDAVRNFNGNTSAPISDVVSTNDKPGNLESLAAGAVRGALDLKDTISDVVEYPFKKGAQLLGAEEFLSGPGESRQAARKFYEERYGNSTPATIGRAAENIALTLPVTAVNAISRGGMIGRLLNAAGQGAAGAGAVSSGYNTPVGEQIATGAVLGPVAELGSALLKGAVRPIKNALTPEGQRLANVAQKEGVSLTPAQKTDSKPLRVIESTLSNLPTTAGKQRDIQEESARQFNRAVLQKAGIDAEYASPEVLQAADRAIGNKFQQLSQGNIVKLDNQYRDEIAKVVKDYGKTIEPMKKPIFDEYLQGIEAESASGFLPGEIYQNTRSRLSNQAKSYVNTDSHFSAALRGIRKALDDAAERYLPAEKKGAWQKARQEYATLKNITKAMNSGSADAVAGNIPPAALYQSVKNSNPKLFPLGKGELNELARVGKSFLQQKIPDSGTAQRLFWQGLLTGSVGWGSDFDPKAIAASLLLPKAAQASMYSKIGRNYLTKGAGISPEIIDKARNIGLLLAAQQGGK